MERQRGFETNRLVTVVLLFSVLALPLFVVAGCGEQLARMEENQIKLQAMVAANTRDLATISSQLHTGQGKINESIQTLDTDTQQVAAGVTTVQNEQRQFRDAAAAGHEGLNRRITQVQDSQGSLQAGVAQVSEVTQRTAADLTTLTRDQAALHESVQANQRELTGSLGTVVSNQQTMQTSLIDLRQANQQLASGIASLAAKDDALCASLEDGTQRLAERLAALASGHGQLGADVTNVRVLLQTMSTDLTAANSTLKEQLGATGEKLTAQITGLSASQQHLQAGLDTLGGKAEQTTAELADTRSSLQETLRVSREVLTGQMAASLQNQETLHSDVRDLNDKTDKLATNIGEVATGQAALHQTLQAGIHNLDGRAEAIVSTQNSLRQTLQNQRESLSAGMTELANGQQNLRVQMDTLAATTGQTALDVLTLNEGQAALQQTVRAVEGNLSEKASQTSTGLKGVAEQQIALQQSLATGHSALAARATELAQNQRALQDRVDHLDQAAQRVASDLVKAAAGQDTLYQTLKAHDNNTRQQATALADIQGQMKTDLDTLTAMTGQTSLDLLALGDRQAGLTQAAQAGMTELGARTEKVAAELTAVAAGQNSIHDALNRQGQTVSSQVARIADGQQQLQGSVDALTATAAQTGLDVIGMTARQEAMQSALQNHNDALGVQMTGLADGQQQMQSGLDTLTATTSQTALDVIAGTTRQEAMAAALQSHDQAAGTQMAQLAADQQEIQSSLDIVTATAGQTSLDTLALSTSQERLGQAVQAGRQEMAEKLAAMAQSQQSWADRLDNAQAKVATMADNIAALDQQIARLQTVLQTGLQDTTALLGTTGQQRQQFEAKVSQDVQAVIDSLGQLRQMQASLQEQIMQVQRSTQGQADSLRSVIEQMKATPNATDRAREQTPMVEDRAGAAAPAQPPADVKVSSAVETPQVPEVAETQE